MQLFIFSRYLSAHREDGFAVIVAPNLESAEHIMAERFYGGNHEIAQNRQYCMLIRIIEIIPDKQGLIACDDVTVGIDF